MNALDGLSSRNKILQLEITDLLQIYDNDLPSVIAELILSFSADELDPITSNPLNSSLT